MEPNENHQFSSYYSPHHPSTAAAAAATTTSSASPTNGMLPPHDGTHMVYPHSVPSAVTSQLDPTKRKRGRPRKYGTPEQALAAKKATSSATSMASKEKKVHAFGDSSSGFSVSHKKSQLLGNAGQAFTPHVINVATGEDAAQKIMLFMQQSKRDICIMSASGSISNASLRQPATSGGNITYEGKFEIISLSGSYVRTEIGGRTGGLSVCLSSLDGQIIGGGVGGPLKAAGPVQVIVGTFLIDSKDTGTGVKGDTSASKLPSAVGGAPVSSVGFRTSVESSGRNPVRSNDDHQIIGTSHFTIQPHGMSRPTDWRGGPDARSAANYELTGRTGHGTSQSPENGDYDQIPD